MSYEILLTITRNNSNNPLPMSVTVRTGLDEYLSIVSIINPTLSVFMLRENKIHGKRLSKIKMPVSTQWIVTPSLERYSF